MPVKHHYSWKTILSALFLATSVNGQFTCIDFLSPKTLNTDGTRVGTLIYPLTGSKYRPNQNCMWIIDAGSAGMVVKFQVITSNLQGRDIHGDCSTDYVDIFDWKSNDQVFIGRFCGSESGQMYESTGRKMSVQFTSNIAAEFSGFMASYQAVEEKGNDLDAHSTMLLAICIPVGVILLILTIPFSWKMVRLYLIKRGTRGATNQGQQLQLNEARLQGFIDHDTPDGVFHNPQFMMPPPSYDSLNLNALPVHPPPYEEAVKETMPKGDLYTHVHGQVQSFDC